MNVWDCQQVLMYKQIGCSAYSLRFLLKNKKKPTKKKPQPYSRGQLLDCGMVLALLVERTRLQVLEGIQTQQEVLVSFVVVRIPPTAIYQQLHRTNLPEAPDLGGTAFRGLVLKVLFQTLLSDRNQQK